MPEALLFYALAAVCLGSAAVVVLARSLIHSAFALLFTFVGVAGLYFLLGADFLGAAQLLIYVGGILVLLLFGVMLTHKIYDLDLRTERRGFAQGLVIVIALFAVLALGGVPLTGVLGALPWARGPALPPAPTTAAIGDLFLGRYLLPFEVASMLLLVALVGAALIVRRRMDA